MEKLSVYIVTLNEEARLPATLEAARKVADEIVVVDSGSTDKTVKIAEKYGAKTVFHKWKNISSQKHFAQNLCRNDWVLSLDADEVLSPELVKEIKKIMKNPTADAYWVKIVDRCPGDEKPRFGAKKYHLVRLYDRRKANMPDDLTHDRVVLSPSARTAELDNIIYHDSYLSLFQLWIKYNLYTNELITTALKSGRKYSLFRLLIEFPWQFLRYYFVKRFFLRGVWGFIMAVSMAYFRFLKIAKYFEYKMTQEKSASRSRR